MPVKLKDIKGLVNEDALLKGFQFERMIGLSRRKLSNLIKEKIYPILCCETDLLDAIMANEAELIEVKEVING